MDWSQSCFVLSWVMRAVEFERGARDRGSPACGVDLECIPGWRKKVNVSLGGLETAPAESIGQTHRRRCGEVARPLGRRERTRPVRGFLRVSHASRRQEDNRNDPDYGMTPSALRLSIHPKWSEL